MEEEYQKRRQAISRYYGGEKPSYIYTALGKVKQWLYFWLKRYQSRDADWYKDKPKSNKIIHNKTPQTMEQMVCKIRQRLSNTQYAQKGVLSIQWELKKLKVKLIPPVWTINRILKRNNLIKEPEIYQKRNKVYPKIAITTPHMFHQMDLIGPRYLGRANKFYAFNLIDIFSNAIKTKAYPGKKDVYATDFLVLAWQKLGIPQYLQVDNELSFKGSNRHPRTFGAVIKLCLYLGIEIIFIPEAEPWRNGVIEKFNDVYDKMFFRTQVFASIDHLNKESLIFENFHNKNHRYGKLKGQTPWDTHISAKSKLLRPDFSIHKGRIPFRDGKVSFIRLTDEKGKARFFTETFLIDKELVNEYVKGTVFTKLGLLKFYYNNKIIKVYKYKINKH